ncbi:uncharacterized protein [Drosophila takahashii]|uniref:uncharacterized protein n=1 Tax=Drosophila takahashii TaxID=29030 RepID=UPI001CF91AAE|nr:uncharacterized protein LOC108069949 [Drosophila takahashii]
MSLKLDEALELLIENMAKNPTPGQQLYDHAAIEIAEKINQEFTNINSIFKGTMQNLDKTYAFFCNPIPKIVNGFLKIKMPFKTEPQRAHPYDNCEAVYLKTSVNHPAVRNGYVIADKLINLFHIDLSRVIDRISQVVCKSEKSFSLSLDTDNWHTFTIKTVESGHGKEMIYFIFGLLFSFSNDSDYYFIKENKFFHEKYGRNPNDMRTIHMVVHTLLTQLKVIHTSPIHPGSNIFYSIDWTSATSAGDTLLEVIKFIIPKSTNPGPLKRIYEKLLMLKKSDSVEMAELKALFHLH